MSIRTSITTAVETVTSLFLASPDTDAPPPPKTFADLTAANLARDGVEPYAAVLDAIFEGNGNVVLWADDLPTYRSRPMASAYFGERRDCYFIGASTAGDVLRDEREATDSQKKNARCQKMAEALVYERLACRVLVFAGGEYHLFGKSDRAGQWLEWAPTTPAALTSAQREESMRILAERAEAAESARNVALHMRAIESKAAIDRMNLHRDLVLFELAKRAGIVDAEGVITL